MSAPAAVHHRWDSVEKKEVAPGIVRQFVSGARVSVARFTLANGTTIPTHSHENEQVSYVVRGAVKFRFSDRDVMVRGGELIVIPSQVPHGVDVVEDSEAIDVFNPVRQDWIDGTDTYFKTR